MPSIDIQVDVEGNTTWKFDGLTGVEVLGVMSECIFDMYSQLFDVPDRPFYDGGNSRVCIEYDGENVSIAYRPDGNVQVARGLTTAALAALCKRAAEPDFNSLEGVLGAIMSPVRNEW